MIPIKDDNPTRRRPYVTLALLLACTAVYFLWQPSPFAQDDPDAAFNLRHAAIPCEVLHDRPLTEDEVIGTYEVGGTDDACELGSPVSPPFVDGKVIWWSVIVSLFLHGSITHLVGNLLFLWIFGNNVEDRLGRVRYLAFYLVGGVVATLTHVALSPHSTIPMVGASGAIAAVMGAYLVWFPEARVQTVVTIVIVRIRAKWLLGFWFLLQFFTAPNSGVAWAAHVGGFLFGALVALLVRTIRPLRRIALVPEHREGPWDSTGGPPAVPSGLS